MSDTTTTPTNSDPQDLINAALGTTTPEPAPMPSTEPQSTPVLPEPAVMPSELTEAPPLPSPEPVAPTTVTSTNNPVVMGDDTPLAFVGGSSTATNAPLNEQKIEEPVSPILGTSAPMDAIPQVVPVSTLPIEPIKTQKKSKVKTILVGLALFLAIVAGVGAYSYQQYGSVGALVAGVLNNEDTDCPKGKHIRESDGKCVVNDLKGGGEEKAKEKVIESANSKGACEAPGSGGQWCESVDSNGKSYAFCMKNDGSQGSCNTKAVEKGFTIFYGAGVSAAYSSVYQYQCACGTAGTFWFDRPGVCNAGGVTKTKSGAPTSDFDVSKTKDPDTYDKWGLCGLVTNKNIGAGQKLSDYFGCFNCDSKGCHITSTAGVCASCTTVKYTCKGQTKTSCLDNQTNPANSSVSSGKCGTVEQIDVMCGSVGYIGSTTILNGACDEKTINNPSPIPSPSVPVTAPKLMCDGLTRTPTTTPVIGDKLTFTCTGSSVPAGSVALTYKFRSSIDSGVWSTLTNKTATTAEMTINACGTYKVQCQACGTISGAVVCDPVWTGATSL